MKSVRRKSKSRTPRKSGKCRDLLSKKIAINIREYKEGRYVSPAQAIAVSYSQVQKKSPKCRKSLRRKRSIQ
jgi:hypothetical protein